MTANRPAPALSAVAGEFDKPSSGSTGEPPLVDGMPALRAASGSLVDAAPVPKAPKPSKPAAAPITSEPSVNDEVHQILAQEMADAASDLQRPLPSPPDTPKPQRRSFDHPDDYDAALASWGASQAHAKATVQAEKQRREEAFKEATAVLRAHLTERGLSEFADYESVALADHVPISEPMASAILRTPGGFRVAYHLGKHIEEAARISKLPPIDQISEIGRLAVRVAGTPTASKPKASASRPKTPDEMSMEEWAQKRTPELRAAAKPWHTAGVKP